MKGIEKFKTPLKERQILPVICMENQDELDTFLKAISMTNIKCVEITLRHPFSFDAISYIKENHPKIIVGAGTVNSKEVLNKAIVCGADFLVAPGTLDELLLEAENKNIPFLPGVSTPSEIMKLSSMGYKTLKLFPAECLGGVNVLKLYKGAFSDISFLPTGGITAGNVSEYLKCGNVVACGGSFMIPKDMLKNGDFQGICDKINEILGEIK